MQRGQVLLRVADPDGRWQLELHMPEDRMGHIAQVPSRISSEEPGRCDLHPGHRAGHDAATARSARSHRSAEVRGEEGNTVLIKVDDRQGRRCRDLRPGHDGHGQGLLRPPPDRLRLVPRRDRVHPVADLVPVFLEHRP